ncbi:Carboxylesterase, type B [Penicillium expansum]|nr:Carboxylesterase, type B [Penicillium expansum]
MVALKQFLQLGCMLVAVNADCTKKQQPVVDLGYEIYQATGANNSNAESITCAQGAATWQIRTSQYLNNYMKTGNVPNVSYSDLSAISSGGVEDCLFLDVQVPRKILDSPGKDRKLSPVLVWIHGGGFTSGSKNSFGSSKGLIDRSQVDGSDGVVYVALNYRLGAFGFLSGSSFEAEDGVLNAGLYDQRLALQWIQDNIYRFGGDKNQVTVFGESAGGGSIMHHITAYGGAAPALFNRAVPQSPAYFPYRSPHNQEKTFKDFLTQANVTSLAEARQLPSDVLVLANSNSIGVSHPYASAVYGPTPDGSLVKVDPKVLLRRGEYDQSVNMLISHNKDEGLVLVPAVHTNKEYEKLMKNILTRAKHSTIDHITKTLYPPVFDGSKGYTNNYQRAALTAGDIFINCNAAALNSAFKNDSHAYFFNVSPSVHAQDTGYTFYTPNEKPSSYSLIDTGAVNQTVAFAVQDYILSLAKHGIVNSPVDGLSSIPAFGSQAKTVRLTADNITISRDPVINPRCQWWSLDLFD